ncbi:MAG: TetR/AcrR family transcriptional regulator C-terminal domain-containing protein [Ktedonobacterales bacterium]
MKTTLERTDLRVRRTHKLLWDALMAELAERSFEEITVKDICERAMVHRTTFYKHYVDKYALLEQGIRQMFDALWADEEHRPPSAFSVENPPPHFIRLFEHAAHHQQFYRVMLCKEEIGRFQQLVKEYIVGMISARAHAVLPDGQKLAAPVALHAHFMAGATLSVLAWWLDNDMPLSPTQMARYLMAPHGMLPAAG